MFKRIAHCVAVTLSVCSVVNAADMQDADLVKLSNSGEIADAKRLNDAVDLLSVKVSGCVNNSVVDPGQCHCLYPEEKSNLEKIYHATLRKHPDWRGKVLFWQRADSYSYNLSLDGLERSLHLSCPPQSSKMVR